MPIVPPRGPRGTVFLLEVHFVSHRRGLGALGARSDSDFDRFAILLRDGM
jgi:hypothetical protein